MLTKMWATLILRFEILIWHLQNLTYLVSEASRFPWDGRSDHTFTSAVLQDDCAAGDGLGATENYDDLDVDMPRVSKDSEKSPVERFVTRQTQRINAHVWSRMHMSHICHVQTLRFVDVKSHPPQAWLWWTPTAEPRLNGGQRWTSRWWILWNHQEQHEVRCVQPQQQ